MLTRAVWNMHRSGGYSVNRSLSCAAKTWPSRYNPVVTLVDGTWQCQQLPFTSEETAEH